MMCCSSTLKSNAQRTTCSVSLFNGKSLLYTSCSFFKMWMSARSMFLVRQRSPNVHVFDGVESLLAVDGPFAQSLLIMVFSMSELVKCVQVVGRGVLGSEACVVRRSVSVHGGWSRLKSSCLKIMWSIGMDHIGRSLEESVGSSLL